MPFPAWRRWHPSTGGCRHEPTTHGASPHYPCHTWHGRSTAEDASGSSALDSDFVDGPFGPRRKGGGGDPSANNDLKVRHSNLQAFGDASPPKGGGGGGGGGSFNEHGGGGGGGGGAGGLSARSNHGGDPHRRGGVAVMGARAHEEIAYAAQHQQHYQQQPGGGGGGGPGQPPPQSQYPPPQQLGGGRDAARGKLVADVYRRVASRALLWLL